MKIIVEISDADAKDIRRAIAFANNSKANTHGVLNFEVLTIMLLEDVALAVRRAPTWLRYSPRTATSCDAPDSE